MHFNFASLKTLQNMKGFFKRCNEFHIQQQKEDHKELVSWHKSEEDETRCDKRKNQEKKSREKKLRRYSYWRNAFVETLKVFVVMKQIMEEIMEQKSILLNFSSVGQVWDEAIVKYFS